MSRGVFVELALAAVMATALADEMYTTKYDNVDVQEILSNPRLYQSYLKCLLGDGDAACTPEGKQLRRVIPDALKTRCSKCNEKQKATVKSVINGLRADHADDWAQLRAKWDPDNQYFDKYQDLLE
ncbi:Chemosensory protein 1 [Gryllus bimaculatus]|nr:Chemosensory protein 1 [Gryllus bimaculatus]